MASERDTEPKMSLLGYKVDGVEMAIACNHPSGVVLSLGDKRIELDRNQCQCLQDLLDQFLQAETEL